MLEDEGIWFNKEKCQVLPERLEILEHILSKNGLEADLTKIDQVNQFLKPTNARQLQKFMGIVNYVKKFGLNLAAVRAYNGKPLLVIMYLASGWLTRLLFLVIFHKIL